MANNCENCIPRDSTAIKCKCGGYAEKVKCTKKEINSNKNCGADYACCVAAFVCCICKKRTVVSLEAPEMN
jgi:hypothetical protein